MTQRRRHLYVLCFLFVSAACSLVPSTTTPFVPLSATPATKSVPATAPPMPTRTPIPTATHYPTPTATRYPMPTATRYPTPTATPEPEDTGWKALAPGVEWRWLEVDTDAGRERLRLVRAEPTQIRLRVVYQPTHPRKVSQWASILPDALVVINAGYFSSDNRAMGLIVSDGISQGRSYDEFAGMLAVSPNGQMTLRWLRTWPFRTDELLAQAVQSFPVLIKPGGRMGFPPDADRNERSRRTVVAQDTAGRIVFLVSPGFRFSLHALAMWLAESDLELDIAMNLDGGTSTGFWISSQQGNVDSRVPVPAVIAIEPMGG